MKLHHIENLIERYLDAETSLKEEQELRDYFSQEDIAPHLASYKPMFAYYASSRETTYTGPQPSPKSKRFFKPWMAIASSVVLILAAVWYNNSITRSQDDLGTYENPELALEKTKEILNLVSYYMNEGNDELVYITQLEKTKNKLVKDNN